MKILIRTLALCLLMAPLTLLSGQSSLTVEITDLESNKGGVIIDLLDVNEKTVRDSTCLISDLKCSVVFKDLKNGQYAIRFIHDEDQNEELDTNFLGIPKEGFGFSNDAMGKFGPKDFSEWLFDVQGDNTIRMSTKYMF